MNILAIGTCCVDVFPQKDIVTPGGEALNISVHLSMREDVHAYLFALIGDDTYSDRIVNTVKQYNINTDHLYRVKGETANHVIQISDKGERYFENGSWRAGVSADLSLSHEDQLLLRDMDAVLITLWEKNLPELIKLKDQNHYFIAADCGDLRDFTQWEDLFGNIDILFFSADDSMKHVFYEKSKTLNPVFVLTFGEYGSVAYHEGDIYDCPAVHVKNVVDTTGCGDCYQGHFVAEYFKTKNIQLAMNRATLEAAKVTEYVGGFPVR